MSVLTNKNGPRAILNCTFKKNNNGSSAILVGVYVQARITLGPFFYKSSKNGPRAILLMHKNDMQKCSNNSSMHSKLRIKLLTFLMLFV